MARPTKEGLDYFPLDVDIDQDDKIALIEAKHDTKGFYVVIKLLMKIYKNSYFYMWTEREQLLFSKRINVDINLLNAIVNDCLEWHLFNEVVFKKHKVLTSKGIQSRYLEAVGRRKEVVLNKDYLLITPEEHLKNSKINVIYIVADKNTVNDDINSINDDINPQSKVKESKGKESKETKDLSSQIENLRQRYSSKQLIIIDDYLDMIRHTRKSAKMSDSVVCKMYEAWDKHPTICVEYGCKTHLESINLHSKMENYTLGIIRNTSADEAASKLNNPQQQKQKTDAQIRAENLEEAMKIDIARNQWISEGNDPEAFRG